MNETSGSAKEISVAAPPEFERFFKKPTGVVSKGWNTRFLHINWCIEFETCSLVETPTSHPISCVSCAQNHHFGIFWLVKSSFPVFNTNFSFMTSNSCL